MTTIKNGSEEYTLAVGETGVDLHWRGSTFTIEPRDLEDGGWEFEPKCGRDHCDDGDCPECDYCRDGDPASNPARALERWHNDQGHHGALRLSYEEPCKPVAEAMGVWGG